MRGMIVNVVLLSEGNTDALKCLMGMIHNEDNMRMALRILPRLYFCKVTGSDLGVLFKDLADSDYERMAKICEGVPPKVLAAICKKRDGKGKELIERYLLLSHIGQN